MNRDTLMAALEVYSRPRMLEDSVFEYGGPRGRTFVMGSEAVARAVAYIHKLEDMQAFLMLEPSAKVVRLEQMQVELWQTRTEMAKLEDRNKRQADEIMRMNRLLAARD
jgi:hypothetical protein